MYDKIFSYIFSDLKILVVQAKLFSKFNGFTFLLNLKDLRNEWHVDLKIQLNINIIFLRG